MNKTLMPNGNGAGRGEWQVPLEVWAFHLRSMSSKHSYLAGCSGICSCVPSTVMSPMHAMSGGSLTATQGEAAHSHFTGGAQWEEVACYLNSRARTGTNPAARLPQLTCPWGGMHDLDSLSYPGFSGMNGSWWASEHQQGLYPGTLESQFHMQLVPLAGVWPGPTWGESKWLCPCFTPLCMSRQSQHAVSFAPSTPCMLKQIWTNKIFSPVSWHTGPRFPPCRVAHQRATQECDKLQVLAVRDGEQRLPGSRVEGQRQWELQKGNAEPHSG